MEFADGMVQGEELAVKLGVKLVPVKKRPAAILDR